MENSHKSGKVHSVSHNVLHLLISTIVACALLILHIAGFFERFDHFFLVKFQSNYELQDRILSRKFVKNTKVIVLEIKKQEWIKEFQQASPLRRDLLAKIIKSLFPEAQYHRHPTDLVIDLDLSPSILILEHFKEEAIKADSNACVSKRIGIQPTLEHQLMAQKCLNAVLSEYGKRIVLHQPSDLDLMSKQQQGLMREWQSLLAKNGVFFSSSKLELTNDTLVTYNNKYANLAKVAALKRDVFSEDNDGVLNFNGFLSESLVAPIRFGENYDLDFNGVFPDFSNKIIFLGINNGISDLHNSPFGKVSGVLAHAVNYYSYLSPFKLNKYKPIVLLVEILLGFWLAKLLGEIWQKRISTVGTDKFSRLKRLLLGWVLFTLPLLIALIVLWAIQILFQSFIWASPSLFMFSIWIKAILERSEAFKQLFRSHLPIQTH